MRVVFLNQFYAPAEAGTAQLLRDLAEALAAAGHDVAVVCGSRSYPDPVRLPRGRERLRGVLVHRTWTTGFGRGTRLGRVTDYLTFLVGAALRLLLQRRPDVVVSLTTPPLIPLVGLVLARVKRARSVLWMMDVYPELAFELGVLRRESWVGRLLARLADWSVRHSDRVVALGERMAGRLEEHGARRVEVIHNWEDGQVIRPLPLEGHPQRREWKVEDAFVVLYSGNLGLAHEFATVLDAAQHLDGHERIRFVFVGVGPRRGEVEQELARRGLGNVELRPFAPRERLGESLTAGDVHLVTLRNGMQGLMLPCKIYGVLASGRPCLYVGPADCEVNSMLAEAGCGARIAVGDAEGLARAVVEYARDGDRCRREGERARSCFESRYDRVRGLRQWSDLLESLSDPGGQAKRGREGAPQEGADTAT